MSFTKEECELLIGFVKENPQIASEIGEKGLLALESGIFQLPAVIGVPGHLSSLLTSDGQKVTFQNANVVEFFVAALYAGQPTKDIPNTLNHTNRLQFDKRFQIRPESVSTYYLTLLNRTRHIKIIELYRDEKIHFFSINHSFNRAFPYLEISIDELLDLLKIIAVKTENDMAGGGTYKLMEELIDYDANYTQNLYEQLCLPQHHDIVKYLPAVIAGLIKQRDFSEYHSRCLELLAKSHREQIWAALTTMRSIPYEPGSPMLNEAFDSFKNFASHTDDQVRALAVQGISALLKLIPSVINELRIFANSTDLMHKFPIAVFVWQETKSAPLREEIKELSLALPIGNLENQNFFNYVNWHIADAYRVGEKGYALKVFRLWMEKGSKFQTFEHALHTFKSDFATFLQELTGWFNSGNHTLLLALTKITGQFDRYDFLLDKEAINRISGEEVSRVIGAITGFVYSRKPLASLTVSILDSKHADDHAQSIANILADYVCYTYPSTLDEHIKPEHKKATGVKKRVLREVIRRVNNYYQQLRSLPTVPEFFGSELRISEYMRTTSQNQEAMMASAKGRNVFATFAQNITLRTADIWFTKHEGNYTKESRLEKMEYSFELPRAEFIDPANFEHFRMRMRNQALSK